MCARRLCSFLSIAASFLSLSVMIASTGCAGSPPNVTGDPPTKSLTSISLTPPRASIRMGATQQFSATAKYSDNTTADVSPTATWKVTTQGVATINSTGLATGVASGSSTITASVRGISGTATLTVQSPTKTLTSVSVSPVSASVWVGATQQFAATARYSDGSTADVSGTATWTVATQGVASVASSGLATAAASGSTTVTASLNGMSGTATLTVGANVPMWHFDARRSGLNAGEGSLTPANVTAQTFGKIFSYLLDGYAYGQPLLLSNMTINGSTHNVVFVATEKDSVYAFDADTYGSGSPLWQVSLLQDGEGPITNGSIQPYLGITSTPAIDLTTNTMYVVSTQTSASGSTFRLHALDITRGA